MTGPKSESYNLDYLYALSFMAIPLIIAALAAGGTLVPHAAGGLIVTSATGYVAGTYLSTAAVTGILASTGVLGTSAAVLSGAAALSGAASAGLSGVASSVIGSTGIFGTTIGSSGLTGMLMSAGVISATPVWVPVTIAGTAAGVAGAVGYIATQLYRIRKAISQTSPGQEMQFTERQAKLIQAILPKVAQKGPQST